MELHTSKALRSSDSESLQTNPLYVQQQETYKFPDGERQHDIEIICPIDKNTLWAIDEVPVPSDFPYLSILFITLGEEIQYREVFRTDWCNLNKMSYSKSGYLYLTVDTKVLRLDLKGKVEEIVNCEPNTCGGLFAYDSDDILVGVIPEDFGEKPKILKFNKNGESISKFSYYESKEKHWSSPESITVNPINGDLLVHTADSDGRRSRHGIVALTAEGKLLWELFHILDEKEGVFFPEAMCCTETGKIIIVSTKRVTLLDSDGTINASSLLSNICLDGVRCFARIHGGEFLFVINSELQKLKITIDSG